MAPSTFALSETFLGRSETFLELSETFPGQKSIVLVILQQFIKRHANTPGDALRKGVFDRVVIYKVCMEESLY
ncbi:MAG: hypothetical protein LBL76_08000 [Treponema sp.]|nr:hypothetical protein [Treponema sp.]